MASVRGPDPCLAAGSDPDCVTTNRDRDTTYVGTGPCQLPWPLSKKGKSGQTRTEKEIGQNRKKTHLNQRKKSGLLLLFAFAFALHLSFSDQRHQILKKNQRQRKKGVRIQAIIGRIRTPDPDPGHFGPDFDSGSGLESASTDPSPCVALTHSRLRTFTDSFWT